MIMRRSWLLAILFCLIPTMVLAQENEASNAFLSGIDQVFSQVTEVLFAILFFEIGGFPLVVLWLLIAAIFFTIRMKFVNVRMFGHAINIVRGKYDDPNAPGEVSHFQALAAALSATVGLGNIAGVAIAIGVGGPGASFWMTLGGLLGMSSKFVECTLGQKYRVVKPDGSISGGGMYYLSQGLARLGKRSLGKVLAIIFAIACIGGAFGGGNMFQAKQSFIAVSEVVPLLEGRGWLYGLILASLVALVIIGGIRRIGQVAGTIVPVMCILYVLASVWILLTNFTEIPNAIAAIFQGAFSSQAVAGGFVGVMVQGLKRSTFSNEAGLGSAAIAHSAAKTDSPIKEGLVALLEPFIDTVIVCNMTALVIIITGVYNDPANAALVEGSEGAALTSVAFGTVIEWFPILLSISVFFFAFSTMISWSYYGEKAWDYLFGSRFGQGSIIIYKILFLVAIFIGSVSNPTSVLDFSDALFFAMAFPNLLGAYLLSNEVAADLKGYTLNLKRQQVTE